MANFKEKLLGLIDNSASTAMGLIDTMNETINSIDWDTQFNYLNDLKESLLKKGDELLGEFNELVKQVKNNITDFEVIVPFDEAIGEKFECKVDGNKLVVEVSFKDDTSERNNKTIVNIPQNCDIEKMTQKYNAANKTMTVVIPKTINEPLDGLKDSEKKPMAYNLKKATTPRKKPTNVADNADTHQAESKLLKKFRENTAKVTRAAAPRAANGRFIKRS